MKKLLAFFKNIPTRVYALACIILTMASCVAVSGTLAAFRTTVTGVGEAPISEWGFNVKINGYSDSDNTNNVEEMYDSIISNVDLAYGKGHVSNFDESIYGADGELVAGASGYLPIEIDGTQAQASIIVTIKIYFINLPTGFTITDNLGRELTITRGVTDFEPTDLDVRNDFDNVMSVKGVGKPMVYNGGTVSSIEYKYYLSYKELAQWKIAELPNRYIDVGFRWKWVDDDEAYWKEKVYTEVRVTGQQVISARDIKDATIINFAGSLTGDYGLVLDKPNVLNILTADIGGTASNPTQITTSQNLYLDVNNMAMAGSYYSFDVKSGCEDDVKSVVVGTLRRQTGYNYPTELQNTKDVRPIAIVNAPKATNIISADFTYDAQNVNSVVFRVKTFVDTLNGIIEINGTSFTLFDTFTNILAHKGSKLDCYGTMIDGVEGIADEQEFAKVVASIGDSENQVLWDSGSRKFVYLKNGTLVETDTTAGINLTKNYKLFKVYDVDGTIANISDLGIDQTYSVYLAGEVSGTIGDLIVGLDVGSNDAITAITYNRPDATEFQKVIIRTKGSTTLTINSTLDYVMQYKA